MQRVVKNLNKRQSGSGVGEVSAWCLRRGEINWKYRYCLYVLIGAKRVPT